MAESDLEPKLELADGELPPSVSTRMGAVAY